MPATLVKFPAQDLMNLPSGLRNLADSIENGDFGDAHNLAWVIDCGSGRIELGLLGAAPEAGGTGHLLFAIAQRKLEVFTP